MIDKNPRLYRVTINGGEMVEGPMGHDAAVRAARALRAVPGVVSVDVVEGECAVNVANLFTTSDVGEA